MRLDPVYQRPRPFYFRTVQGRGLRALQMSSLLVFQDAIVQVGLNVEEKYGSQAMRSEIFRVFMDDNIKSSAISIGRVACVPGGIESTPPQFS